MLSATLFHYSLIKQHYSDTMGKTFSLSSEQLESLYDQITTLQFAVDLFEKQYEKFMDNYAKENLDLIKNTSKNIRHCVLLI